MGDAHLDNRIPLKLEGRPYLPVFVNGTGPYWFIFDTGAQSSSISPRILEALSLKEVDGAVSLKELRIGGLVWNNLKLGTGDTARIEHVLKRPIDGLVGNCFMIWAKLAITIDYPRARFAIYNSPEAPNAVRMHIGFKNYYPIVPVQLNDTGPYAFLLDTGASFCTICPDLARRLDLTLGQAKPSRGVTGDVPAHVSRVRSFGVGDSHVNDLEVLVSDCSEFSGCAGMPILGLIGHSFLRDFVMTLDYPEQMLALYGSFNKR
jgi:hypothetical protein